MLTNSSSILKKLLLLFLIFAGLYFAKQFLMPLVIGAVLATLFLPFCKWMESIKLPRGLAALICLMALVLAIAGIFTLLGWQISELTNDIDQLKQRIIDTGHRIQGILFSKFRMSAEKQSELLIDQQPLITDIVQGIAGSLTSIFTYFILTLAYVLFLLYYRGHIKLFLLKLSPLSQKEEMAKVIYRVAQVSQQYLLGLSKMIVCLWIMYALGFSILGIKNALFFAFLCGLLEIVPFIGNLTGTLITLLVTAIHGASIPVLVGIVCIYGVIQFIQGWILEPLIVGSQVKINPFFTILALVIGELVWGIPGIFIAIPIIAMLKIVCDHIEPLKSYGFLMGETNAAKKEPDFLKKLTTWYKKK